MKNVLLSESLYIHSHFILILFEVFHKNWRGLNRQWYIKRRVDDHESLKFPSPTQLKFKREVCLELSALLFSHFPQPTSSPFTFPTKLIFSFFDIPLHITGFNFCLILMYRTRKKKENKENVYLPADTTVEGKKQANEWMKKKKT